MSTSPGVTFRAWWRGERFIPLIEVLLVLGPSALNRRWTLENAEFAPGWRGTEELHRAGRESLALPTLTLVDLVSDGVQLIDGQVTGEDVAGQRPC
jgi:hypothetical protein